MTFAARANFVRTALCAAAACSSCTTRAPTDTPRSTLSPLASLDWHPELDQPIRQLEEVLATTHQQQPMNYTSANLGFVLDAKLYLLFERYVAALPSDERPAAIGEQRLWLAERVRLTAAAHDEKDGGTFAPLAGSRAFIDATNARIAVIQQRTGTCGRVVARSTTKPADDGARILYDQPLDDSGAARLVVRRSASLVDGDLDRLSPPTPPQRRYVLVQAEIAAPNRPAMPIGLWQSFAIGKPHAGAPDDAGYLAAILPEPGLLTLVYAHGGILSVMQRDLLNNQTNNWPMHFTWSRLQTFAPISNETVKVRLRRDQARLVISVSDQRIGGADAPARDFVQTSTTQPFAPVDWVEER